jgi:RNA polymerase sigma-70 factor (ECF subfamily)
VELRGDERRCTDLVEDRGPPLVLAEQRRIVRPLGVADRLGQQPHADRCGLGQPLREVALAVDEAARVDRQRALLERDLDPFQHGQREVGRAAVVVLDDHLGREGLQHRFRFGRPRCAAQHAHGCQRGERPLRRVGTRRFELRERGVDLARECARFGEPDPVRERARERGVEEAGRRERVPCRLAITGRERERTERGERSRLGGLARRLAARDRGIEPRLRLRVVELEVMLPGPADVRVQPLVGCTRRRDRAIPCTRRTRMIAELAEHVALDDGDRVIRARIGSLARLNRSQPVPDVGRRVGVGVHPREREQDQRGATADRGVVRAVAEVVRDEREPLRDGVLPRGQRIPRRQLVRVGGEPWIANIARLDRERLEPRRTRRGRELAPDPGDRIGRLARRTVVDRGDERPRIARRGRACRDAKRARSAREAARVDHGRPVARRDLVDREPLDGAVDRGRDALAGPRVEGARRARERLDELCAHRGGPRARGVGDALLRGLRSGQEPQRDRGGAQPDADEDRPRAPRARRYDRGEERRHRLETPSRIARERAYDRRALSRQQARLRERGIDLTVGMYGAIRRGLPDERVDERERERVLIAARIDRAALRLLRRHVRRRADDGIGVRQHRVHARGARRRCALHLRCAEPAREPEVGDLRDAVGADEHVRRLEVAVHEAGAMRGREPGAGLAEHREDLVSRARTLDDPRVERLPRDVLHRQEHAIAVLADVEDLDDVRMRQLRHRLRFAPHPQFERLARLVGKRVDAHELDHDGAPQLGIAREADDAHPARADRALDHVAADACTRLERRGGGSQCTALRAALRDGRGFARRGRDIARVVGAGGLGDDLAATRAGVDPLLDLRATGGGQRAIDERERVLDVDAATRTIHVAIVAYDRRWMTDEDPVAAAWQRCRDARPAVVVPLEQFRAYLAERRPADVTLAEQLTWCIEDLYLACACCAGDRAAVIAAERELVPVIDAALTTWDSTVRDETRQKLRAALLVDHASRGPLLAQYSGRGKLTRWVRVVATREAGKTRRADLAQTPVDDDALFDAVVPPSDPRVSAIKRDAAVAFKAAFLAALGELDRRERTVLRLHVSDGLSIDEIAPIFDVHRATIARWIAAAKDTVLAGTRKRLMQELKIGGDEVDSLIRLVQSRIELADDPLRSK